MPLKILQRPQSAKHAGVVEVSESRAKTEHLFARQFQEEPKFLAFA
jgi:hypothetical protein